MYKTWLLSFLLIPVIAAAAPGQREDQVLILSNVSGKQAVYWDKEGGARAEYQYTDRGRGVHIKTRWRVDADGILIEYEGSGHNYLKAPVQERFRLRDGKAVWKNRSEQGERALSAPSFYVPADMPPEILGVLARALLKAPHQELALLPAGRARIERAGATAIDTPEGRVELTLYQIIGVMLTPQSLWLEANGDTAAMLDGWGGTLPARYRDAIPKLQSAQDEADSARAARLAKELTHVPSGPLVIRNARMFDPRDLGAKPGMSVLVRGERIVRVAPDASLVIPEDAEVIEARGRFLMPGLWDVHKHYADADGLLDIATGITSARDLANDPEVLAARIARFDAGTEVGPRVLKGGLIDGTGVYAAPTRTRVDTPEQALQAVDWYADHGYAQVKLYSSLKPELVPLIADRAHARGLRVSGHVPAHMSARMFVEAGADEIQHFNFMVLNFLYPRVQETRDTSRFTEVAEHVHEYSPEHPQVRELIAFLKSHHVVLDPTINFFEDMFSGDPTSRVPPGLEEIAPRLPPQVQRELSWGALVPPKGQESRYREAFPMMLKLLKAFHDGGVTLIPGTDALGGYSLQYELMLYARAGIPNAEVLRIATLAPAEVFGVDTDRGVITAGKLADMVLIDGDPLRDMADIRRVDLVFKGGKVFDPTAVERALGITPRQSR